MSKTNRIEYKRELTPELDIKQEVGDTSIYVHTLMIVSNS